MSENKLDNMLDKISDLPDIIKAKNNIITDLTLEIEDLRKFVCAQEIQHAETSDDLSSRLKQKDDNINKLSDLVNKHKKEIDELHNNHNNYIIHIDDESNDLNLEHLENKKYDNGINSEHLLNINNSDNLLNINNSDNHDKTKLATTFNKKLIINKDKQRDKKLVNMEITDSDEDSTDDIKPKAINSKDDIINGWDEDANITLRNWYYAFKEISHSYQYILDRNYKISSQLNLVSVVSSSTLSIFAGFKLWLPTDIIFQNTSNIIMLVSNLVIAGITTMSKRYIDDTRNEKIKTYIEQVDQLMNLVYAQYCLSPIYRLNAKDFFTKNNETYTKIMVSAPNLSIAELELTRKNYKLYRKTYHNHDKKHIKKRDSNSENDDTVEC